MQMSYNPELFRRFQELMTQKQAAVPFANGQLQNTPDDIEHARQMAVQAQQNQQQGQQAQAGAASDDHIREVISQEIQKALSGAQVKPKKQSVDERLMALENLVYSMLQQQGKLPADVQHPSAQVASMPTGYAPSAQAQSVLEQPAFGQMQAMGQPAAVTGQQPKTASAQERAFLQQLIQGNIIFRTVETYGQAREINSRPWSRTRSLIQFPPQCSAAYVTARRLKGLRDG